MQGSEIKKSNPYILIEIVDYVPNSMVSKTLVRKATGNIKMMAIDIGESLSEKKSPFDTFLHIIEGSTEVIIDKKSNMLHAGDAIIIPAHATNLIKSNERYKMISTVIKSGKDEGIL